MNSLFLKCDCGGETLSAEIDDGELILSIYSLDWRYTFWHKIKLIWHILRTGKPYTDQIVLSKENAFVLRKYIEEKYK
jgi:hypothetical protein